MAHPLRDVTFNKQGQQFTRSYNPSQAGNNKPLNQDVRAYRNYYNSAISVVDVEKTRKNQKERQLKSLKSLDEKEINFKLVVDANKSFLKSQVG
jgi:hypothetical protein